MTITEAKERIKEIEETDTAGMDFEEKAALKDMALELKNEFGLLSEAEVDDTNDCLMCGS